MPLPPRVVELIQQHPLKTAIQMERVLAGDLENAARRYAKHAGYRGTELAPWTVWIAIQEARGLELEAALEELAAPDRRWLGVAALKAGQDDVGMVAYGRYLKAPGDIGPFTGETKLFLDALVRAGRGEEALQWVTELEQRQDSTPGETLWAVRFLLRSGQSELARRRSSVVLDRMPAWADGWAVSALIAFAQGDHQMGAAHALKAARRGLADVELAAELRACLGSRWDELVNASAGPAQSYDDVAEAFRRSPGRSLVPSDVPSVHSYGGTDFIMPPCHGCGHAIREWFSLDLTAIPELAQRLPDWPRLPLLGCADCMVWMGRHDYVIEHAARRVTLRNVAISVTQYGDAFGTLPALQRRYARLTATDPTESPYDACFGPLVGGVPLWTQGPEQPRCPECDEPMVYVAAMTTPDAFDPPFVINNESGAQYHFACNPCGILSVIAQWT
jgi:hypothetical protein